MPLPTTICMPDSLSADAAQKVHTAIFNGDSAKVKKIIKTGNIIF